MKFREWINAKVEAEDIIPNCTDPGGNDADNPIYPLGCSGGFNNFKENNNVDILTNHPNVNTELLFYSYGINSGFSRRGFRTTSLYNPNQKSLGHRAYYKSILDKRYTMTPLSGVEYFSNLGKYKFVISPEGNGIDCFRHYETWISKGIPIIPYNNFIARKYSTLPILWTQDYSEINDTYLNTQYEKFLDKEYDFRRLLLTKYTPRIQFEIANICNHHTDLPQGLRSKEFWKYSDYFKN